MGSLSYPCPLTCHSDTPFHVDKMDFLISTNNTTTQLNGERSLHFSDQTSIIAQRTCATWYFSHYFNSCGKWFPISAPTTRNDTEISWWSRRKRWYYYDGHCTKPRVVLSRMERKSRYYCCLYNKFWWRQSTTSGQETESSCRS